jgi:hypothetical protein
MPSTAEAKIRSLDRASASSMFWEAAQAASRAAAEDSMASRSCAQSAWRGEEGEGCVALIFSFERGVWELGLMLCSDGARENACERV